MIPSRNPISYQTAFVNTQVYISSASLKPPSTPLKPLGPPSSNLGTQQAEGVEYQLLTKVTLDANNRTVLQYSMLLLSTTFSK